MMLKQRLELDWVGKDDEHHLEPRILIQSEACGTPPDQGNYLIHGDNLLALKALESEFSNKVKAVFIDPPYNTGSAFAQYDDGVEHSLWLSLMRDRLVLLRRLLTDDGSIWISIDDNESHYLKVLCDEIFGRHNFVSNVIWQKKYAPANDSKWLSDDHDHILVYAKDKQKWRPNLLPRTEEQDALYANPDNDPRGPWMSDNYTCAKSAEERPNLYYPVVNPNTKEKILPKKTRVWAFDQAAHKRHVEENRIYWGKDGTNSTPRLKKFLSELRKAGRVCSTIWPFSEVGHNQDAKREALELNKGEPFATPKPEKLLQRIITLASNEGDIVLDSFAGSGTTGAVAHKMSRRWIMVELGPHCFTHILPRLKQVVEGKHLGGITENCSWKGGGGFRTFELAPSLLLKDHRGNWIINPKYDAIQLSHAVCKHEGFKFWPDSKTYWKQGYSTEKDFIFVTTQFLTAEHLAKIASQMKPDETLLICAKAYRVPGDKYSNITIKKIPQMLLGRCEFGRDDYSLNVKEQVQEEMELDQ